MVYSLAMGLKAKDVHCEVASYLTDGILRKKLNQNNIQTHLLKTGNGLNPKLSFAVYRLIKQTGAQLIHTHHIGPYVYAVLPAKLAGIPIVHTEHSRELYGHYKINFIGRSMDALSTVVCVADEIAAFRAAQFGKKPLVIENGVQIPQTISPSKQLKARKLLGINPSDYVVGCVARISPEKDHSTLLKAFQKLNKDCPSAKLVLVGTTPKKNDYENLTSQIAQMQLSKNVLMLGNRNDVDEIYPCFDVIALSSKREGLPLALLEGMAHGIPAVATSVGGITKLLSNGGGITMPAGDIDSLASALTLYENNVAKRKEHGDQARKLILSKHSETKMVEDYLKIYSMLLGSKTQA